MLISNIIRRSYRGISDGNADGIFVGEKCEHFFRLNVCIEFRVSSMFGQSDGACPTHQKVRPLSPVCRTCTRRIVQTWKRHGIRCKHSAGRNAHIFLKRIFHLHFHMKSPSMFLNHITYQHKAQYASCGSSSSCRISTASSLGSSSASTRHL